MLRNSRRMASWDLVGSDEPNEAMNALAPATPRGGMPHAAPPLSSREHFSLGHAKEKGEKNLVSVASIGRFCPK